MTVRVLLFASLRQVAGRREIQLELPQRATVRAAADALRQREGLELQGVMCAINERYAGPASELADGDVLALLPPVSGG